MLSNEAAQARPLHPPKRVPQLDFLRGVAIILVLLNHAWELPAKPPSGFAFLIGNIGWTGVDLFFVLSGYLIGGLLFREIKTSDRLNVGRFLVRRAFKIWPGYFALLAYVIFRRLRHGQSPSTIWHEGWPNLLHLQNYFTNLSGHTWSLAVEEHFYLLLPLLLGLFITRGSRNVDRWFPIVALAIIILVGAYRCIRGMHAMWSLQGSYFPTHLRIDGLLFGVLISHLSVFRPDRFLALRNHPLSLISLGIALLSPMVFLPMEHPFCWTIGYTLLYVGYGLILIALTGITPDQPILGRLLYNPIAALISFTGLYSYAIYLWHQDLVVDPLAFRSHFLTRLPAALQWPTYMLLYFGGALAIGVLMTLLIETPFLKLRDRLTNPARRSPSAPTSVFTDTEISNVPLTIATPVKAR